MPLSHVDVWGIDNFQIEAVESNGDSSPMQVEHKLFKDDSDCRYHAVVAEVGLKSKWRYIAAVAQDSQAKQDHVFYHLGHFRDLLSAQAHIDRLNDHPEQSIVATLPVMQMDDGHFLSLYQMAFMSAFDTESFSGVFEVEHGTYCLMLIPEAPGLTGIAYEPIDGIPRYVGSFDSDQVSPAMHAHHQKIIQQGNITLDDERNISLFFDAHDADLQSESA